MTEPSSLAALQTEMQELAHIFTSFRRLLREGTAIDLTGLDERIKEFCQRVEAADAAKRQALQTDFQALLDLLESLETELRAARDRATQS